MNPIDVSPNNLKRISLIDEHYDLTFFEMNSSSGDVFLDYGAEQKCRFCKNGKPEVTFNKLAHAVPELIGNKTLFSKYECDICNRWFNTSYEDQFAKYTHPLRTLGQTFGKKGVPSIKLKKSWINFSQTGGLQIFVHPDDPSITIDETKNAVVFSWKREPYRPRSVFKCLVKMALSIMHQRDIGHFSHTIAWLMTEPSADTNASDVFCCHSWFKPGPKPIPNPWAVLAIRKIHDSESLYPHAFFFLAFDNLAYQIIIPFSELDHHIVGKKAILITFPDPFDKNDVFGPVHREPINFSSNEKKTDDIWTYALHYDKKLPRLSTGDMPLT